ncbi:MAG TPA: hypothetical protein DEO84_08750 [candidate division Zixibacteria bacterium]|nr:hypothetical protein [candidate division Zixibacteria bacterium]
MKSLVSVVTILCIVSLSPTAMAVTFSDVTQQANLNNYPDCRASAWVDYDRDGYLDLLIGSEGGVNRLHRNLGDGTFSNVTLEAQIPYRTGIWGVNFADIDNDGFDDLYLSARAPDTFSAGRNVLLHNSGLGYFDDISDSSGANVPGGGVAACFAPFSKGPFVDLFVPNQYYPSREFPFFLSNNGNNVFSDETGFMGLLYSDWWDIPIAFDYDNDGRLELFCTKDFHGNSMYDQPYGHTFINVSDSLHFQTSCGYGATVGDVNNDGWFDLYITNWHDYTDKLFLYDSAQRRYRDNTSAWGAPATTWTSAAHFADFDNDGLPDLFVTGAGTGNTYYHNQSGQRFTNLTSQAGLTNYGYNWGASIGDYDNDGFLDIFVPEYLYGNGGKLYHNNGNNNNWVEFELEGTHSNKDAIGAKLVLQGGGYSQMRQVIAGSGFGSQNSLVQHFGVGQDTIIGNLWVFWPGTGYDIYDSLIVNTRYHIVEGEALAVNGEPVYFPKDFRIVKTYPNPFNSQTQIEICVGQPCNLTVDIVDILGREVKSLLAERLEPRMLTLAWDGTDQRGDPISSGIYFCRVTNGIDLNSSRLLLIK